MTGRVGDVDASMGTVQRPDAGTAAAAGRWSHTATDAPAVPAALATLVAAGNVVVLTGAGVSTASGIPDYRGVTGRTRTAPPMQWDEFAGSAAARRRYWARGQVGFRRYADIAPNPAHTALARLERLGLVTAVVTQNVDGLHRVAGSGRVVELHGSLAEVVCMGCGGREPRRSLQSRLDAANPWLQEVEADLWADGDAALDGDLVDRFEVLGCIRCGGDLRPDVVFFGEFVPRPRMVAARRLVEESALLLVAGSSLAVGSGRLLLRHARRHGAAVAIVNLGPTRGDRVADVRLEADVTVALPSLAATAAGLASTTVADV